MDKNELVLPANKETGFTLVEVLIASVILAMVMTGLAYVFLAVKVQSVHANSRIQAAELAKYYLTTLSNEVRQDQWGSNCLQGGTCPDGSYAPGNLSVSRGYYNVNYSPYYDVRTGVSGAFLQRVKLRINWTEPSY